MVYQRDFYDRNGFITCKFCDSTISFTIMWHRVCHYWMWNKHDTLISKSPLPTNVLDVVNTPLPDTLDIDDSGGNNSCSLSNVARCSTILDKNTPPSEFSPDQNYDYTSGYPPICSQLHPPLVLNEHNHPFGIKNAKFQCFLNSVLQLIFSIFRNISYTSPFNSSMEGAIF